MSKRMTLPNRFAYVASAPWSLQAFRAGASELTGEWILIESRTALTSAGLREFGPRYVFFPHWSWHVPDEVVDEFECVCFHMTDLPYGRGATPLQNLILRRHKETKLTALRMVRDYDAGPVYMKRSLSLEGSAKQIYQRAAEIIIFMMREIIARNPSPTAQVGAPTIFERRKPDQSRLPQEGSIEHLYDFIRMLDAEGYPHAFLDWGEYRIHFTDARIEHSQLRAGVRVVRRQDQG